MKASDRSCDERKAVCERISEMFQVMQITVTTAKRDQN